MKKVGEYLGLERNSKPVRVAQAALAGGIAAIIGYTGCILDKYGVKDENAGADAGPGGSGGPDGGPGGQGGVDGGPGGVGGIAGGGGIGGQTLTGGGGIGGHGGHGGHPEGGNGGGGAGGGQPACDPAAPNSLTVESDNECVKVLQTSNGGAVIVQAGSTPDNKNCQTLPSCMANLQPGDYEMLAVKNTIDGCITFYHTAVIKQPGVYAWCVNDFSAPPGPTQAEMQGKLLSGGYTQVNVTTSDNPLTVCYACPANDWVAYRIDIGP